MSNSKILLFVFLFSVFCVLSTILYAQVDTAWVRRYSYSTGANNDEACAIAVDTFGNVYVAGYSYSPTTNDDFATIKYNAQGIVQWVQRYNGQGIGVDKASAIALDNSGNVYVTGSSQGSGTAYDYATVKYNSAGVQQWVARYNGPANSGDYANAIAVDNSGNVYVTGYSYASGSSEDFLTIKYNSLGETLWVRRYNGNRGSVNRDDYAKAIAVDNSGNVYVAGRSVGSSQSFDFVTVKYSADGVEQWVQRYNAANEDDQAFAIVVDGDNNIYVTGASANSITGYDYVTIKYNSDGAQQWLATYDGGSWEMAYAIALDNLGNVYVTGESYLPSSYFDYATVKYNPAGVQQWVRRYNGPYNNADAAVSIAVDGQSNVYVTGYSFGLNTSADYATIKYNSNGNQEWVARYDGPGNDYDEAKAIAVDYYSNVYVTGRSYAANTYTDYATIKYVQTGAIEENREPFSANRLSLKIYPNPAKNHFTVRLPQSAFGETQSVDRIIIYDISGKVVKEIGDCHAYARNDNTMRISLDGIKNGVYFVKVTTLLSLRGNPPQAETSTISKIEKLVVTN